MARSLRAITLGDQIIRISELPSYSFRKLEGGDAQEDLAEYASSNLNKTPSYAPAKTTYSEITISKPFEPPNDITLLEILDTYKYGSRELTIIQATAIKGATDFQPGPVIRTFKRCHIKTIKYPNYDEIGTEVAMLEVTLQPEEVVPGRGRGSDELTDISTDVQLQNTILDSFDNINFNDFGFSSATFNF